MASLIARLMCPTRARPWYFMASSMMAAIRNAAGEPQAGSVRQAAMVASSARMAGSSHRQIAESCPSGVGTVAMPNGSLADSETPTSNADNAPMRDHFDIWKN
jgi:hypothetical protein